MSAIPSFNATPPRPITGRHVLAICLGFFGVMIAVNAAFVFFAVSTFNGGEGGRAYQTGLNYNAVLEAARAQDRLGWSHRVEAGGDGVVRMTVTGKDGTPVAGLALKGDIARPAADTFTRTLAFREAAPGSYRADAGNLDAGSWVVSVSAAKSAAASQDIVYRAKERLWLKPNS